MKKIPTLFRRDPDDMRHVLPQVNPECSWVLAGEGVPTRKFDGTCVMQDDTGSWWARREVKPGKATPPNYRLIMTDQTTGKAVGWEPIEQSAFAKFLPEALAGAGPLPAGTYELVGPKINGNPEHRTLHTLFSHDRAQVLHDAPRSFEELRAWLADFSGEGIVWHHPDGRMAKLKRRDFPAIGDDAASYGSDVSARMRLYRDVVSVMDGRMPVAVEALYGDDAPEGSGE